MISGQQALFEIEQATAAVRSQEAESARLLAGADQELAELRAGRSTLLRQLAGARLDAMQRENVVAELASAERRALQVLADARASLAGLSERIDAAQKARAAAEAERRAKAAETTQALTALEDLQAGVEAKVRSSAEWIAQKELADRAQHVFEAADAKAARAEQDRAAKGKPYEDDPLFMYLWSRGFATSRYRSGLFVRFFDEKVARLVGFAGARANYTMLKEIPLRLREHAERCRAASQAEREKLTAIEKAGLVAAGSTPLEERLQAARTALAEADARLKSADAALHALDAERDEALKADVAAAHERAVEILSTADSTAPIFELYRKAAATLSSEDDSIVRQIEANDKTIAAAERKRADLIGQAQQLAQRRSDIEAERARFYRRGYDSPMGQFSNENAIGDVLKGILAGAIQGAVLGQVLQGGFSERGRRADSGFGGGGGFTFPGGGGSGGGWIDSGGWGGGPGGGSDSGGFGGGDGFRTGGGF